MNNKTMLLEQLKKAADAHSQFHFCNHYYDLHTPEKCSIANRNQHKNKDNYWGLPYDHNLITSIPEYINASPMRFNKHHYIAAQGPRTNTLAEFWQMVLQEKSSLIVSVTNETENDGLFGFKFNRFWPNSGSECYGDIEVKLHSEQLIHEWDDGREEKIRMRSYLLKKGSYETPVHHLHMENWPDGGVIHPESLMQLSHSADKVFSSGPIVVHCAAGIGRTGTFIAFHSLYHDLLDQLHRKVEEPSIDLPKRIHEMRLLRWGAMVAEAKQYELILKALEFSVNQAY